MIFFLTTSSGRHTLDAYLSWKGAQNRELLKPVTYEKILGFTAGEAPPGVYIFTDIERLSLGMEAQAAGFWEALQKDSSRWRCLNRPGLTLRRLELLRRLYAEGINRHRAWPVLESPPSDLRFPIFIRVSDDHAGARSELLNNQEELDLALENFKARGVDLNGWIACEYVGWKRPDGVYAKYAAFMIAGEVVPRGVLFGPNWQVKNAESFNEFLLAEERAYIQANPHAETLRRVFALAGVDYGRVDYGLDADGRLSVWEINTNPQIYSLALASSPHRGDVQEGWTSVFDNQMRSLNARAPHQPSGAGIRNLFYWTLLRWFAPRLGAGRLEKFLRESARARLFGILSQ